MNCGDRLASMSEQIAAGAALYVVGTPIGNLEDITLRALRVLKECDLIACEDTRQTAKLLNHFGISTRTVSYHEHNEKERAEELLKEFARGSRVALVSDAGMPGISDPGYRLIAIAIESKVPVVPVPGPAAFVAALAASGLPTDAFRFNGFLPAKRGQRKQALESVRDSDVTEMFYEAPHRVKDTLEDMVEVLGRGRSVVVAREITKMYEEFLRGSTAEVLATLNSRGEVKGEITLLIGMASESDFGSSHISVRERMAQVMTEEKLDEKVALKKVAKEMGISKSEAYREWQRGKE